MRSLFLLFLLSASGWIGMADGTYRATPPCRSKTLMIRDTETINLNGLSALDRKNYELKVGKLTSDQCAKPDTFYSLSATLKNKSKDTLKYIDMSCSHDIWSSNKDNIWAAQQWGTPCDGCDGNSLKEFEIPPAQSKTIELEAYYKQGVSHVHTKIRVGIILQRVIKKQDWDFYIEYPLMNGHFFQLHNQVQNRIWSNPIEIPD